MSPRTQHNSTRQRSLFDKIWDRHEVRPESTETPAILYVDLHLVHEVTSPQAFAALAERGLSVRRPDRTLATIDHSTPTLEPGADGSLSYVTAAARRQVETLETNTREHNILLHGWDSAYRGVVHVIGPELGSTQPGMTIVCGDSHTATHGAFGALAFGIGTTEVGHVLATQCLLQRKPKSMRVNLTGQVPAGVSAKDLALTIIATLGVDGGTGYVIEYAGEAIETLGMEGRMTVCNMSIEAGARAGMIAPDATTFEWLRGRKNAPCGTDWDDALGDWSQFHSDVDAAFDKELTIDASAVEPMATWGTAPDTAIAVGDSIPEARSATHERALDYMKMTAGQTLSSQTVNQVFVGSCTNGRISDLREAANIMRGRKVAPGVRVLVVPGSVAVRHQAEEEGLDRVFREAGAQWRQPGCSMCIAMNGDHGESGELIVSTSNRNFEGRQGPGARTVLASPATAAAAAVTGHITDPRQFMELADA
jgi:3-isopropylmalate/(R)-2-methylmalate dehydratase large subunit